MAGRYLTEAALFLTLIPFIYYGLALVSSLKFFKQRQGRRNSTFRPPVSILKPVRGVDPDAYDNFASLCVQDYPDYEIVFCIDGPNDPIYSVIGRLQNDFPDTPIRVLFGSGRDATNDKSAKLARLTSEARHDYLVINDSDVRVRPDYLRTLVAPLEDPGTGAVTCFYLQSGDKAFTEYLQTVSMVSEFYAGILTDWNLEGVKFALGPTIAATRQALASFGGYAAIENRPADDLLIGQLVEANGFKVELLPYCIDVVADFASVNDLLQKRLRWIVEMRHIRPWGHFGLFFTQGLLWWVFAMLLSGSPTVALGYFAGYLAVRFAMAWVIGVRGLGRKDLIRKLWMIPVCDAGALCLWLASFFVRSFRWRGGTYEIRNGNLIPVSPAVVMPAIRPAALPEATASGD